MLLSYLIVALSVSFAPLAQGRPAGAPAASLDSSHTPAEPGTLLGRPYTIQERREPSRAVLPRQYAKPARFRAFASPRPYAKYLAERSDDVWAHEHGRRADAGAPNYVSYVGPSPQHSPPAEPIEPIAPFVDIAPPPAPAEPTQPSGPLSSPANSGPSAVPSALTSVSALTATATATPTSTSSADATSTALIAKKLKNAKAKGKGKGSKGAKPEAKS